MTDCWKPSLRERVMEWVMTAVLGVGALGLAAFLVMAVVEFATSPRTTPDPSGIWAGIVDDLPSGRLVECVFARDPSGSVAVTCDWQNAVRGRP